jgi:hypothetical protein
LKKALEILGYAPCHHFETVVAEGFPYRQSRSFNKALVTEDTVERQKILRNIYDPNGYRSAMDYPTAAFVEDLVEIYPDAKFILGTRSSPQAWKDSIDSTIAKMGGWTAYLLCWPVPHHMFSVQPMVQRLTKWDMQRVGSSVWNADVNMYFRHNEHVRKVVPKERLLEFEPRMGWQPLCDFLEVPIPKGANGSAMDYPHVNDSKQLRFVLKLVLAVGIVHWAILIALLYLGVKVSITRVAT